MLEKTTKFGKKQQATGNKADLTLDVIRQMVDYMENSDEFMALPAKIQDNCKNNNELCSFWAAIGECEANVGFMKIQCAPACRTCHLIDMATRCPELPDAVPALKPGDLNKMFERIIEIAPGNRTLTNKEKQQLIASGMTEYSVVVHSRPSEEAASEVSLRQDMKLPPWVITFENFLTEEECDAIIEHGHKEGYKRSQDVGKQKFDGTVDGIESQGRTSENAWCSLKHSCRNATVPARILERISSVLGIPPENSEDFQILRYEVGQCKFCSTL
jgi:prolyl 4-hydroxylase